MADRSLSVSVGVLDMLLSPNWVIAGISDVEEEEKWDGIAKLPVGCPDTGPV